MKLLYALHGMNKSSTRAVQMSVLCCSMPSSSLPVLSESPPLTLPSSSGLQMAAGGLLSPRREGGQRRPED